MVLGSPGGCVVGKGMKVKGYQDLSQGPTKQAGIGLDVAEYPEAGGRGLARRMVIDEAGLRLCSKFLALVSLILIMSLVKLFCPGHTTIRVSSHSLASRRTFLFLWPAKRVLSSSSQAEQVLRHRTALLSAVSTVDLWLSI